MFDQPEQPLETFSVLDALTLTLLRALNAAQGCSEWPKVAQKISRHPEPIENQG